VLRVRDTTPGFLFDDGTLANREPQVGAGFVGHSPVVAEPPRNPEGDQTDD